MTGGGGKTPALLKKLYHIKTMKTRNLIKAAAVLSSIHVLAKMDYANLTMLDYILIVTAVPGFTMLHFRPIVYHFYLLLLIINNFKQSQ